jgi:glycosyltransferase involved in cell wall biosynthesis
MKVSGFTILRDGARLGYPFVESIQSLLPLVDEMVIAVGNCTDETPAMLRAIGSPKIRAFDTVWDPALQKGGKVLAVETNKALAACTGDWCFYLQGDEVVHEQDYDLLRSAMERHLDKPQVEGLSFRYHHFKGSFDLRDPLPYRKQVRIVRNGAGVVSVGDACGFGVTTATGTRKLRTVASGAWIYHYGWVRPPRVMNQKHSEFLRYYNGDEGGGLKQAERQVAEDYAYDVSRCEPFRGTHPAIMRERVAAQDWEAPYQYVPRWRNRAYWDGFMRKNFASLYRWAS